jgi:uncharacterized membrane protein YqiK
VNESLALVVVVVGTTLGLVLGWAILFMKFYKRVPPGEALIVTTPRESLVVFDRGFMVLPFVHRAERVDLTAKVLRFEPAGRPPSLRKTTNAPTSTSS